MEGGEVERWLPNGFTNAPRYGARSETAHVLMKVETHNHPTAISPYPGASTGAGGEIRDEGATGRGARPKAGLTGFSVSNLHLPDLPGHRARAVGARALRQARAHRQRAADHDRGPARRRRVQQRVRPAQPRRLLPRLRADGRRRAPRLPQADHDRRRRSAPSARRRRTSCRSAPARCWSSSAGPACASAWAAAPPARWRPAATPRRSTSTRCSAATRRSSAARRRSSTTAGRLATNNPILAIHDVGAGGLSNAFPELVDGAGKGAAFDLRKVPLEESGLAPKEIWCNESQERYVLALEPGLAAAVRADVRARALPVRDRRRGAPTSRELRARRRLECRARDRHADGRAARQAAEDASRRRARRAPRRSRWTSPASSSSRCASTCCAIRRWQSKRFLVTIGDRTVGGLSHRDQMVGPWQVPVADCAVTLADYAGFRGEAMSMGERTPLASLDAAGVGPHGGRRGRSPTCSRRRSSCRASSSAPTGWPRAASPARTPRCTTPCARSAWSCARRSASAFRSARIRCRCARAGDGDGAQAGDRAGAA